MKVGLIGATGWLGSALGAGLPSRRIALPGLGATCPAPSAATDTARQMTEAAR